VELPDGTPGAENVHAAWRMRVAERAAGVYAGNRNLAALAVAGSGGAGTAGQFSDLELDCYWVRPPADADRLAPVRALDGELAALWDLCHWPALIARCWLRSVTAIPCRRGMRGARAWRPA
jgi:hypothetical protein